MRSSEVIREVVSAAAGRWDEILHTLGAELPRTPGTHGPCPACGGKDRFRFDNQEERGTHICNQCGAGDGLELVRKIKNCTTSEAAALVAEVLAMPLPEQKPARENSQTDIVSKVAGMVARAVPGQSAYLTSKRLKHPFPLLSDGSMLVVLTNGDSAVTGAQVIKPDGSKRLVAGTVKKGSFSVVNSVDAPETVIIAEGLATALSVHLIQPDAMTVAAVDAGNLLPVADAMRRKYPEALIIIAGDNDWHEPGEKDERGKQKVNTGKVAAEKAAVQVSGMVALPPTNHKADWDDYRQQKGLAESVKDFASALYRPQDKSAGVQQEDRERLKPRIESRPDGVYWVEPNTDRQTGKIINRESWLCSPLEVVGIGRDDKDQFLILRWQAWGADTETTQAIPLADTGEREGWRTLKAGGVNVTTKSGLRAILADWLQRSGSRQVYRVAHATGWQCGAYIMPDGEIIGTPEKPVLFNGRSSAAAGYTVRGTTESWRNSVGQLAEGNYSMMTAVAAALAAPLIGLSGADGFGIHFYEQSSAGKTTTANVAASLYGNPDQLRLTWYGTALGLANEAAAHNDALMPLDEIGQGADPVEVYKSAYALFNGTGKLQGAKEGGNRELKRWRTVAISTGEVDMETFVAGAGKKAKAGQLVRLLNIPMSRAVSFHGYQSGKQHADALKDAYQNHYGAAGREWVKWLADHRQEAVAAVRAAEERWRGLIPADYGEQVHRVGSRFAILEAALLLGCVVTGWDKQRCRDAIQYSYNAWIGVFGTGNKEIAQIIEQATQFLSSHGMRRFAPLPYDEQSLPISDLAGYRSKGGHFDDPVMFYVLPAVFKTEVAKGFDVAQFARTLCESGVLKKSPSDKGYQTLTPRLKHLGNIRQRSYLLVQLDESEGETE